ncbi:alpha/beta fold hydrolase [Hoeflea sp. CAU 1731]
MSAASKDYTREMLIPDIPYTAPENETEKTIVRIWSEAFGIADIGVEDDFFDLGGESAIAVTVARKTSEAFGVTLKAGAFLESRTVRDIAHLLADKTRAALPTHIVKLRTGGDRIPIFIVHGAAGILFPNDAFMDGFHDDQPVYAFQVPGYDGNCEPLSTVEDIAAEYLRCMKLASPRGPWHLAGFCHGSWIAFEMARRLADEGQKPLSLTLLDPGVQEGRMHSEFMREVAQRRCGMLSGLKLGSKRLADTIRCYSTTGKWIDPSDPAAYDIPEVWDYIQKRNGRKLAKAIARDNVATGEGDIKPWMADRSETFENERELEFRRSPQASHAANLLKRAFHKYSSDTPLEMPVHLIASAFQAAKIDEPSYPLRRLMPNLEVTVLGKYHHDTISTRDSGNSSIIQRVADEASQD